MNVTKTTVLYLTISQEEHREVDYEPPQREPQQSLVGDVHATVLYTGDEGVYIFLFCYRDANFVRIL